MRKITLIIGMILLSLTLQGQTTLKRGAVIGNGGNTFTIDSIIKSSTFFKLYNGATELLSIDTATMLTKYIQRSDTSGMLTKYARKASPTFTGTVTLPSGTSIGDVSSTEIGYVNGVTSAIQTQFTGKVNVSDTASMLNNYLNNSTVSVTEAGYLDGVTSAIQTQLSVTTVPTQINDSIAARLAASTVGVALADSNDYKPYHYATPSFVKDLISTGGDGSLVEAVLQFTVDETGAPSAGDSTLTHTNFTGNAIDIYRDGAKQYKNTTATNTVEGFRLNTNTITVNPVFQANEQIIVSILDPVTRTYLSLEGEESALLDSIAVYYKLDETSGSTGDDANDIQNAVLGSGTTATTDHAKFNYARHIGYKSQIRVPYNAASNPDAPFSVSMWIYADSIGGGDDFLFSITNSASPYNPIYAKINTDGKIDFRTRNSTSTEYVSLSTTTLSESTLYHIVLVHRGDGKTNLIYIDGVDVTTNMPGKDYTFSGTLFNTNGSMYFGNTGTNYVNNFRGYMDECAVWHQAFTPADVTLLNGLTVSHPFTE